MIKEERRQNEMRFSANKASYSTPRHDYGCATVETYGRQEWKHHESTQSDEVQLDNTNCSSVSGQKISYKYADQLRLKAQMTLM
jgi:hypothetical protein